MIPSYYYTPVAAYLWQVTLHSLVAGTLFYVWSRHLGLRSGPAKRWILCVLLLLPLVTALVPGRSSFAFREERAWLDSMRVLALPLLAGLRIHHLALGIAAVSVVVSLWQEVLPALRRPRAALADVPEGLVRRIRALPDWEECRVGMVPSESIFVATAGRPSRPRLVVSAGALRQLTGDELQVVLLHENAHWRHGRWLLAHVLFGVRMLQCFNPVALWAFREHSIEVEIDCDADAVRGRDPKTLARALMKVYESVDRRDYAARGTLRKRVNALLTGDPPVDETVTVETVVAAAGMLLLLLPWIV